MPLYIYKAATREGQVVRNRVEELNRFVLLKKLKTAGLMPIKVTQIQRSNKASKIIKKQKRNVEGSNSVLKAVREEEIAKRVTTSRTKEFTAKAKKVLFSNTKITNRDIVVFTQDFYLLKKANFNNIHALSTIIEGTENESFRAILEDILLGVEAGENMYTTMEYYTGIFPPIYINMIKVGELSRITYKSIRASSSIFR
ncbi:MAG: type II secretion system F family protein [Clostridia bacterium]|nr:type II secretion system F family protein [Clostridia bacterium]